MVEVFFNLLTLVDIGNRGASPSPVSAPAYMITSLCSTQRPTSGSPSPSPSELLHVEGHAAGRGLALGVEHERLGPTREDGRALEHLRHVRRSHKSKITHPPSLRKLTTTPTSTPKLHLSVRGEEGLAQARQVGAAGLVADAGNLAPPAWPVVEPQRPWPALLLCRGRCPRPVVVLVGPPRLLARHVHVQAEVHPALALYHPTTMSSESDIKRA